jgi:deoxyadenosine/deoxycytidine kinase
MPMQTNYFLKDAPEMDEEALLLQLEAQSEAVEKTTFIHYFTEAERIKMLSEFPERLFAIDAEIDDMKEEMAARKRKVETLKKEERALRISLRVGYEEKTESCFKMIDWQNNLVNFVDQRGIIVQTRPLKPEERQLQLETPVLKMSNQ